MLTFYFLRLKQPESYLAFKKAPSCPLRQNVACLEAIPHMTLRADSTESETGKYHRTGNNCLNLRFNNRNMELKIACPKCDWEPDGGSHWSCSCGHKWNTFETYGKCPNCTRVWRDTRCPGPAGGCGGWSKHVDWYRNLDDIMREQIEELLKEETVKI